MANQSRRNSVRAGIKTGAHVGQSQQLKDTFNDPVARRPLSACLPLHARATNPSPYAKVTGPDLSEIVARRCK